MKNVLAKFVSNLFHPLLTATWVFILFSFVNRFAFGGIDVGKMGIMIMINTFFFPAFCVFLMWRLDFIPSLKMLNKEDRTIPFFAAIICYIWAFMVVKQVKAPGFVQMFILGAAISIVLSFITNLFFRLSLHMVGIGAAIMLLMLVALLGKVDVAHPLVACIIIAGVLGSARMIESKHTISELYIGLLVGFVGQLFAFVALSYGGFPII